MAGWLTADCPSSNLTDCVHVCLPACLQTRWYSFQFLMMELMYELHDLYHAIREVLTTLPHGL